jgi:hypothetical protein
MGEGEAGGSGKPISMAVWRIFQIHSARKDDGSEWKSVANEVRLFRFPTWKNIQARASPAVAGPSGREERPEHPRLKLNEKLLFMKP